MRPLDIIMNKLTGPMPRAPLEPQDLGVIHTDAAAEHLYRDDAWRRGFLKGICGGLVVSWVMVVAAFITVSWLS